MRFVFTFFLAAAVVSSTVKADTFYVAVDGQDSTDHDGQTSAAAWKSLAFACEQVPEGAHTIEIGAGVFEATATAYPKAGVTIAGSGVAGANATRIVASQAWLLAESADDGLHQNEYLIAFADLEQGITIRNLVLESAPEHRITGGVFCSRANGSTFHNLLIREFRWNGIRVEHSSDIEIHHCRLENASAEKIRWHGGMIRSRWLKNSRIHHNRITSTVGGGYGYKAGGHEGVRIDHNYIDVAGEFAIESAHELEFGVEIDHNVATRCLSLPKSNQSTDPNTRNFQHTFWVHHNLLTDSYTIEGPRNHLRVSHNWIRIEKPGGRVYTHHGGENHGPVWFHHNVVENVDRSLIWMNEGLAENIFVYNNTVFCAEAGDRAGSLFGAYTAERLNGWTVKNNIFVAPASQPRELIAGQREVPSKITATGNVCVNLTGVPQGNREVSLTSIGLRLKGEHPWPFFEPTGDFLIDKGVDVGLPFEGQSPDIGAFEIGREPELLDLPTPDVDRDAVNDEASPTPSTEPPGGSVSRPFVMPTVQTLASVATESTHGVAQVVEPTNPETPSVSSPADETTATKQPGGLGLNATELVEVDWMEEASEGGYTMLALGALSVFLLAVILERLLMLRRGRFSPARLTSDVLPLFGDKRFDEIVERCRKSRSTLGEVIEYLVTHRKADTRTLAMGAGDLGGRAIAGEEHKLAAMAVVAGVAPLLGLLGTMIGMIESFKLVEVFGDEGGASLLAGSISKALITTAAGLVLAIPAVFAHFVFKHRTHSIAHDLETQTERVFNAWFLDVDFRDAAKPGLGTDGNANAETDHATVDPMTSGLKSES